MNGATSQLQPSGPKAVDLEAAVLRLKIFGDDFLQNENQKKKKK